MVKNRGCNWYAAYFVLLIQYVLSQTLKFLFEKIVKISFIDIWDLYSIFLYIFLKKE